MTMWDEIEAVRDLLRTGLAPIMAGYTQDQWNQHKCERGASMLDRLIQRHVDATAGTKAEREKRKKAQLRDYNRNRVCRGCHYNRYNYESAGDRMNAPTTGDGCWHLHMIKRGKCPMWHESY